jgi:elongation factor Ts
MLRRSFFAFQSATPRIDIALVKELRFRTDAPLGDCQAALKECGGDTFRAIEWLKNKGAAKMIKVGSRATAHGTFAAVSSLHYGAFVIHVGTETDFAARNATLLAAANKVKSVAEGLLTESKGDLLAAPAADILAALRTKTNDIIASCVGVMGENVSLRQVFLLQPPALPLPGDKVTDPLLKTFLFGKYTHNSLPGFSDIGSVVSVACVVANRPGAVPDMDHGSTVLTPSGSDLDDLAQHVAANLGDTSSIVHQSFLGSEETVGKWLKKRGLRFGSALMVDAKYATEHAGAGC